MTRPVPQPSVITRLQARLAEVEAEASAVQSAAERQLACYGAVIGELQRLIEQLTPEDSTYDAT